MPQYADIALPVAIDKLLTYAIPEELRPGARIGCRAIVPVGRRFATGLIVDLPTATAIPSLRPIRDIIDAEPVVTTELLNLCRWVSDYYLAPLGEVLKTAMPHGFAAAGKRVVRPARAWSAEELDGLRRRAPRRHRLLSLLADAGELTASDLARRAGLKSINSVLNDLEREGWIATEEQAPRGSGQPVVREFIDLGGIEPGALREALAALAPKRKRAVRLLARAQELLEGGLREVEARDLIRQAAASTDVLREQIDAGLLPAFRREVHASQEFGTDDRTLGITLNGDQRRVLEALSNAIASGTNTTFLLHGVTGSGKTQVYIEAIRACLAGNRTALILVPEIALTPQIVRRFRSHFGGDVSVVHSRMSAGERLAVWRRALTGASRVIVGPRSAVFAPLPALGLLVVDEEHEPSYKQFDATPRYHARDVAVVRGALQGAVVVLGSATPSAESWQNAHAGKYALLSMPKRIDEVPLPSIAIVDMTAERKRDYAALKESLPEERRAELKRYQQGALSAILREKLRDRLSRHEGVILLQNRRGFAPFVECGDCGYTESCDQCSVTLTYHLAKKHLRCHYCGMVRTPHEVCPECGGADIRLRGVGTQRVEQELRELFPDTAVLRMDLDTTSRKGSHDRILRTFGDGGADILLGTQMVAKGLDFPRVTLVGVISADTQMLLPDFRASERTFQLLTQVAGRAGRSTLRGEVIIQTHQPRHYVLEHVIDHDVHAFFAEELRAREELGYPPFSRLALVECRGPAEERVRVAAERIAEALKKAAGPYTILGPAPAVISRIKGSYRWHIIVKSSKQLDPAAAQLRHHLSRTLHSLGRTRDASVRITIDIDPVGTL